LQYRLQAQPHQRNLHNIRATGDISRRIASPAQAGSRLQLISWFDQKYYSRGSS
jgi:hypothetical protein